jgi:hypothetical protein
MEKDDHMSGVDDRIVTMRFDNAAFMQKLNETIVSLDKLRNSLDFASGAKGLNDLGTASKNFNMTNVTTGLTGATKGVDDLGVSAKSFSMSGVTAGLDGASKSIDTIGAASRGFSLAGITSAVDGVSAKFLALSTIGITALSTLTSKAISAGSEMAKALTIAPVMSGFNEFELKMGAIQTIMAGSGASLETVNEKLQELNTYSDKTIYSFKDMTSNIGKFTNAGVDLDKSVASIQGIANVAALSGANAEEASRAMYNFAQALSSGSVKLMDWKSIELANMATVEFKQQLIDSAVALGKLTKEGDHYKTSAGSIVTATKGFNESLQDQWLSSEALVTTLGRYSDATTDIGKRATAAAQDVKTFSQMIDTLKESAGSGWAQTSEIIFGNFEEGKHLWTSINNVVGQFLSDSAKSRNDLLQGWKDLGGRDVLIGGLKQAFQDLGDVIKPIKEAFRDIFPAMTADRLFAMTQNFAHFFDSLKPGVALIDNLKRTFAGVFAILEIGWTVLKGVFGLFGDLISVFHGAGGGMLGFTANAGDMAVKLNEVLVAGGGIQRFFERIGGYIRDAGEFVRDFKDNISGLFSGFSGGDIVAGVAGRIGERFGELATASTKVGEAFRWLADRTEGIRTALDKVWGYLSNWFGELKDKLAAALKPEDFDGAVDAINVGLLGGIALLLKRFVKNGFNFNFKVGVFDSIRKSFDTLTGTLKAMQTNVKADTLMKIAAAVGILAISMVALSLIDSAALTKALVAMAVGFTQLVAVMAVIEKIGSTGSAIKVGILAGSMILLGVAMTTLAVAVKILSTMSWEELAKGLLGVVTMLGAMVAVSHLLSANASGMISAGIAMSAMAVGLIILAKAVKEFAELSWAEMAKGFVGVAAGLVILAGAMRLMPPGMVLTGAGLVLVATGLRILAEAVQAFAGMSLAELAKGFISIGAGLVIIAGAMQLMPLTLPITAAGLVILGGALMVISGAVKILASMSLTEMAKGLGSLAIMLGTLVLAMNLMTGSLAGAAALVIVANALVVLTGVLKVLGSMSLTELATGLGAIAAVLLVLGLGAALLAPLTPALMSLGLALALIGGAFALFGVGAMLVAKAFEVLAKAGRAGVAVLIDVINMLIAALPGFVKTFAKSLRDMADELIKAGPFLIKGMTVILGHLLDTVIELAPKIAEAIGVVIASILTLMRERVPDLVKTGWLILTSILQGVRDNIAQMVTLGTEIVTQFVSSIVANMPLLVGAAVSLIVSFLGAISEHAVELVTAGLTLLTNLILGIAQNIGMVVSAVAELIIAFLAEITASTARIITAGVSMLVWLLSGISDNLDRVVEAVVTVITRFIKTLADNTSKVVDAGFKLLTDLLKGISDNIVKVADTVTDIVVKFVKSMSDNATKLATAGSDALIDFLQGISDNLLKVINAGGDIALKFIEGVGNMTLQLASAAADMLIDFLNGLAVVIDQKMPEIREAGKRVGVAMADGMTGGLLSKVQSIGEAAMSIARSAMDSVKGFLGIHSPSTEFMKLGEFMADGMALALNRDKSAANSAVIMAERIVSEFHKTISHMSDPLVDIGLSRPIITPVLDLTKVQAASRGLDKMLSVSTIAPEVSISRAREIATTAEVAQNDSATPAQTVAPTEVTFEQNIYAPEALTTGAIYRNTKSQLALAKEELGI